MPAAVIASRMRRLIDTVVSRSTFSVMLVALASTISSLLVCRLICAGFFPMVQGFQPR